MLIVKGKSGKSILLNIINDKTNSLAIEYYNQCVLNDSLWINSDTMDFPHFINELQEYLWNTKEDIENARYQYLIIYTNKGEPTINHKKKIFKQWENDYGFQVIVGCQ